MSKKQQAAVAKVETIDDANMLRSEGHEKSSAKEVRIPTEAIDNLLHVATGLQTGGLQSCGAIKDESVRSRLVDKKNVGKVFTGAELCISRQGEQLYHKVIGSVVEIDSKKTIGTQTPTESSAQLQKGMVYDLGSITQVLASVTIFLKLFEQKLLSPDMRVSRILQTFASAGKETMTLRHLLSHTSGLPAWLPVHRIIIKGQANLNALMTRRSSLQTLSNELYRTRLENLPGNVFRPSAIGYMLLGEIFEVVTGSTFSKLYTQIVARPLKMASTGFIDLEQIRRKALFLNPDSLIKTGFCPWRAKSLHGEVYDEICWALGGVAAHNGLFGTSQDLHRFGELILAGYLGLNPYFPQDILREAFGKQDEDQKSENLKNLPFGWEIRQIPSTVETGKSIKVYQSLSQTGVGLWVEPESGIVISLMTNALQIDRDMKRYKEFASELVREILKSASRMSVGRSN